MQINKIYNESCLDTMARMDDGFIDLTVTSPPYDNLRKYKNGVGDSWGEHIWKPVAEELFRVTKDGGFVVWIVGDSTVKGSETLTSFKQAIFFKSIGFNVHDTMIYNKNVPPLNSNRYQPSFEYMFIFGKGRPKTFNPILTECLYKENRKKKKYHREKNGKFVGGAVERKTRSLPKGMKVKDNIWHFLVGGGKSSLDKISFKHPATFPEQLANDHIISWSNEGDIVYDPFFGSGTTGKMAILNNRNWIGSEIAKEYCDIAEERIGRMA
jgi:DNA modification methylase